MATKWKVEVDWNRDGTYSEVTEYVAELQWFLGFRAPYMGTASEAYLHLTLNNADKRFSPENSSGPLHGNLAPLRPLRVTSDDGSTVRTHWSGWINMIEPAANKYGARQANILATGAMQFLKATETKIELQENQRSDQIIDALIQEVIFPPALSDSWVLGDPDYSKAGESTKLANLEAFRDYEEGVLTLNLAGDNWVRQGGYMGSPLTVAKHEPSAMRLPTFFANLPKQSPPSLLAIMLL